MQPVRAYLSYVLPTGNIRGRTNGTVMVEPLTIVGPGRARLAFSSPATTALSVRLRHRSAIPYSGPEAACIVSLLWAVGMASRPRFAANMDAAASTNTHFLIRRTYMGLVGASLGFAIRRFSSHLRESAGRLQAKRLSMGIQIS